MSKNLIFINFLISFLLGVFFKNFLGIEILYYLGGILFIVLFIIYIFNKQILSLLIFVLIGFIFGVVLSNYNLELINQKEKIINKYTDGKIYKAKLEIKRVYKHREKYIDYIGELIEIDNENIKDIYILVKIPKNFKVESGFILENKLKFNNVENFSINFNYIRFLESKNIFANTFIYSPEITLKRDLDIITTNIYSFRKYIIGKIHELYPRNEALFLAGILIGAREELPKDLSENFNNSGLTHLIAVSGFNITIIIIFLSYLFKYFPVFLRVFGISAFIVFFTLVVGDSAAVIRASLMGLLGYYILVSGRKSSPFTLLLLTGFLMVLFNPLLLNYDIGFHLSFLAVLGLLYLSDYFEKIFGFLPSFFAIKESFVLTFSALVTTLPVMLINFGYLSVFSILTNMLVGWTIPFAMLFGFVSLILFIIKPIIGIIIGFIAFLFLKYVILIVNFFGSLDYSIVFIDFGEFALYLEILYFMLLVFLIVYNN